MESIIKTLYAFLLVTVYLTRFKVFDGSVDMIIIIRIVLESINFVSETILEGLTEVYIRLVCIERTVR